MFDEVFFGYVKPVDAWLRIPQPLFELTSNDMNRHCTTIRNFIRPLVEVAYDRRGNLEEKDKCLLDRMVSVESGKG